jgi:tyrosine-protein kinase Etk/Wzc
VPSLPQRKSSPRRTYVVLMAVLASSFALLMFVFIRKVWQTAALDAGSAIKMMRIKQLIRF